MEKEFRPWRKSELQRVNRIIKKDVFTLTTEEADRLLAFCIFTKKLLTEWTVDRFIPVMDMFVDTLRNVRDFYEKIYNAPEKGDFVYAIPNTIFFEAKYSEVSVGGRISYADTSNFIKTIYNIWQNETIPIIQKCFDKYDNLKTKDNLSPQYIYIADKKKNVIRHIQYICADCVSRFMKGMPTLYYETLQTQKFSPIEYQDALIANERLITKESTNQQLNSITNKEEWNAKVFFIEFQFPSFIVSLADKETFRDSLFLLFSEPQYHDDINTVLSLNYNCIWKRGIDDLLRNGTKCDADEFNSRKSLFYQKSLINMDPRMYVYIVKIREKGAFLYITVHDDYDKFFKMPVDPKYPLDPGMQFIFPMIDRALYLEKQKRHFVEELPDMDMWI